MLSKIKLFITNIIINLRLIIKGILTFFLRITKNFFKSISDKIKRIIKHFSIKNLKKYTEKIIHNLIYRIKVGARYQFSQQRIKIKSSSWKRHLNVKESSEKKFFCTKDLFKKPCFLQKILSKKNAYKPDQSFVFKIKDQEKENLEFILFERYKKLPVSINVKEIRTNILDSLWMIFQNTLENLAIIIMNLIIFLPFFIKISYDVLDQYFQKITNFIEEFEKELYQIIDEVISVFLDYIDEPKITYFVKRLEVLFLDRNYYNSEFVYCMENEFEICI